MLVALSPVCGLLRSAKHLFLAAKKAAGAGGGARAPWSPALTPSSAAAKCELHRALFVSPSSLRPCSWKLAHEKNSSMSLLTIWKPVPTATQTSPVLASTRWNVVMAVCCWESTMDIASVFDWFTQESTSAAEQTDEPRQREIWMKLSELWGAAAQRCRDERSLSQHRIDRRGPRSRRHALRT